MVGALVGVMLHELGHAVFDMIEVPVLGREEDAADEISTFIALQFNKDIARTVVRGNAYLYKVWYAFGAPLYSDEHGTGLQRYFNSLCLAYGGDPNAFKDMVDKGELPKSRAENCAREYQQVKSAFEKTVLPYIDQEQMKKVQSRPWLKLTPQQVALLKQQQQQQSKLFTLAVCNRSAITNVSVALLVRLIADPQKWRALGWYLDSEQRLQPHRLVLRRSGLLLRRRQQRQGGVACVATPTRPPPSNASIRRMRSIWSRRPDVRQGQVAVNFIRRDVDPSSSGITWHLVGGK